MIFIFLLSVADRIYPCWENLIQKINIVILCLNLVPRLIQMCRNQWWCSIFFQKYSFGGNLFQKIYFIFLDRKYTFWVNLVQKIKIVSLSWICYLNYFEYVKFDGDGHFFCRRPFWQVLSEKSIWYFDVTWLIFQQFTCRDLKLVVFLVSI